MFKTWALVGQQVFKSSTLHQKQQKEMPPPSKSTLFIQFPNAAVFHSVASSTAHYTCAWLNHAGWAPWGFKMKNAAQIYYLHSFIWHKEAFVLSFSLS